MPLPFLLMFGFAVGAFAAAASRSELRVSPQPAMLTRGFSAYAIFAVLVLVPASVYFYLFHGDWFLLYAFDVERIPSAVALVGFVLQAAIGCAGYMAGASFVRGGKEWLAITVGVVALALGGLVYWLFRERVLRVGTITHFEGGFGLRDFADSPLLPGTVVLGVLLLAGATFLVVRLALSRERV